MGEKKSGTREHYFHSLAALLAFFNWFKADLSLTSRLEGWTNLSSLQGFLAEIPRDGSPALPGNGKTSHEGMS